MSLYYTRLSRRFFRESVSIFPRAMGPNSCDDDRRGDGRLRFYLTDQTVLGNEVLISCTPGFHTASMWELRDPSNLQYDVGRGHDTVDSGSGPPPPTRLGRAARADGSGPAICAAATGRMEAQVRERGPGSRMTGPRAPSTGSSTNPAAARTIASGAWRTERLSMWRIPVARADVRASYCSE
jgi:hypothetical protein